jgi:hypothetical protein
MLHAFLKLGLRERVVSKTACIGSDSMIKAVEGGR